MEIRDRKQRSAGRASWPAGSAAGRKSGGQCSICARLLAMPCFQKAENLLLYAAFGGEVDLAVLAEQAARLGKTVPIRSVGKTLP